MDVILESVTLVGNLRYLQQKPTQETEHTSHVGIYHEEGRQGLNKLIFVIIHIVYVSYT